MHQFALAWCSAAVHRDSRLGIVGTYGVKIGRFVPESSGCRMRRRTETPEPSV
jgi:hypothetical protein